MVFRREHMNCNESECKELAAYVRLEGKWNRIGNYGSECKKFEYLDLEREEKDRQLKLRLEEIKSKLRQAKNHDIF